MIGALAFLIRELAWAAILWNSLSALNDMCRKTNHIKRVLFILISTAAFIECVRPMFYEITVEPLESVMVAFLACLLVVPERYKNACHCEPHAKIHPHPKAHNHERTF